MIRLSSVFFLSVFCGIVFTVTPLFGSSCEDTVHLSFTKKINDGNTVHYRVQKGDWLIGIIRSQLAPADGEIPDVIEQIKELNPALRDINLIYPGQMLFLPAKEESRMQEEAARHDTPPPEKREGKADSKTDSIAHVVKPGESISRILIRRLGIVSGETTRYLGVIRSLNPHIADLNKIYSGQTIYLPAGTDGKGPVYSKEALAGTALSLPLINPETIRSFAVPPEERLPVLREIFDFLRGEVVTSGDYYVPLPPASQLTIDCSSVPVAEMDDGKKILIDLDGRIPLPVKNAIESRWKNHRIISAGREASLYEILGKTVEVLSSFVLQKEGALLSVGAMPRVQVYCDWILSRRDSKEDGDSLIGIRLIEARERSVPAAIRQYARRNGARIIEIMNGAGLVAQDEPVWFFPVSTVKRGDFGALAGALIQELGYEPVRDEIIPLFSMAEDGFDLSVTADVALMVDGRRTIVNSGSLSGEFCTLLRKKGDRVVEITEKNRDVEVIRTILAAFDLSVIEDSFRFASDEESKGKGWQIVFPGLRVRGPKGVFYLVKDEFDGEIHHLLHNQYNVKVVSY